MALGESKLMKNLANFISFEETDKDIIVSFAIDNNDTGISSLTLHRTLFFEEILPEEKRGVHVTYESDRYEQEEINNMIETLNKQNYDERFEIQIA